jgi:hypothetical protein
VGCAGPHACAALGRIGLDLSTRPARTQETPRLALERGRGEGRRRRHEGNPNPQEGNPNFAERNPSGSGSNSKSGGTKSKFRSLAFLRFFKDLRHATRSICIFRPIPASNAAAMQALRVRLGLFDPSVFVSVPPIFCKQVKGWRRFLRSRMASLRDAWARFPPDLSAAELRCARRGIPASAVPRVRVMSPETEDPRKKTGRSIRCAARIRPLERARSRFEPHGQADGRQPFMPQEYLTNACL